MGELREIWIGLDPATQRTIMLAVAGLGVLLVVRWGLSLARRLVHRILGPYAVGRIGAVASTGLIAGGLLAGSLYLDRTGVVAPGEVIGREETISINRGSWGRSLTLQVRHPGPTGDPMVSSIGVDEEIFDATPVGAAVNVRYVPAFPVVMRLERQSTLSLIQTLVPWTGTRMLALVVSAVLFLGLALLVPGARRGLGRRMLPVAGLVILIVAQLVASFLPPTLLGGPRREATAEVLAVDRMTESWLSSERSRLVLAEPYDLRGSPSRRRAGSDR